MIVRIIGEGQFEVPDDYTDELNRLDTDIVRAVDAGDQQAFTNGLDGLLAGVRTVGKELPADYLGPSDLVLPGPDATIEDVRAMLGEEGLIPG